MPFDIIFYQIHKYLFFWQKNILVFENLFLIANGSKIKISGDQKIDY